MTKDLLCLQMWWSEELTKRGVMNVQKDGGTILALDRQFSQVEASTEIQCTTESDLRFENVANGVQGVG